MDLADRIEAHLKAWGVFDPSHDLLREAVMALRTQPRSRPMAKKPSAKKAPKAKTAAKKTAKTAAKGR